MAKNAFFPKKHPKFAKRLILILEKVFFCLQNFSLKKGGEVKKQNNKKIKQKQKYKKNQNRKGWGDINKQIWGVESGAE